MKTTIFDCISEHAYLRKLYPNGLIEPVFIGKICCEGRGRLSLLIHTKQKPNMETPKWGIWGIDYNIIVIHLFGIVDNLEIKNNYLFDFADILVVKNTSNFEMRNAFTISHKGDNWSVNLDCSSLSVQEFSQYIL
jgi:hypothetical protein